MPEYRSQGGQTLPLSSRDVCSEILKRGRYKQFRFVLRPCLSLNGVRRLQREVGQNHFRNISTTLSAKTGMSL